MSNRNYVTNIFCNGTDIGTIFAPNFSGEILSDSSLSPTGSTTIGLEEYYIKNDGWYLITFNVSFSNGNTDTTGGIYGLLTTPTSSSTVVACQFPVFSGNVNNSVNANGPYYMTSYVYLTTTDPYKFFYTALGSDRTNITYIIYINNISTVI